MLDEYLIYTYLGSVINLIFYTNIKKYYLLYLLNVYFAQTFVLWFFSYDGAIGVKYISISWSLGFYVIFYRQLIKEFTFFCYLQDFN